MSDRSPFITSFMYRTQVINEVEQVLREWQAKGEVHYTRVSDGFIAGVLRTLGWAPEYEFYKLQQEIDERISALFDRLVASGEETEKSHGQYVVDLVCLSDVGSIVFFPKRRKLINSCEMDWDEDDSVND